MKPNRILIIQSSDKHIDWSRSLIIGLSIAMFITFINLFLKPFKTAESSQFLVLGYSGCFLVSYCMAYGLEYFVFNKLRPFWANRTLAFFVSLFILGDLSIYVYDLLVIKSIPLTWDDFLSFTLRVMIPFGLLVLPMIYLGRTAQIAIRQGDALENANEVILKGASSREVLHTTSDRILYAKAEDNYCDITYLNTEGEVNHQLFRIKISQLVAQIDCLIRCHRGFAVNPDNVAHFNCSKTKATLHVKWTNEVLPVSKSYMKYFKPPE